MSGSRTGRTLPEGDRCVKDHPAVPQVPGQPPARPGTARRLLLTLEELGSVRSVGARFELAERALTFGMAHIDAPGLWDVARPHMEELVGRTGASSSMAQPDGSDIVHVARVSVPRIIAVRVAVGTRFPDAHVRSELIAVRARAEARGVRRAHDWLGGSLDCGNGQPSGAGRHAAVAGTGTRGPAGVLQ